MVDFSFALGKKIVFKSAPEVQENVQPRENRVGRGEKEIN